MIVSQSLGLKNSIALHLHIASRFFSTQKKMPLKIKHHLQLLQRKKSTFCSQKIRNVFHHFSEVVESLSWPLHEVPPTNFQFHSQVLHLPRFFFKVPRTPPRLGKWFMVSYPQKELPTKIKENYNHEKFNSCFTGKSVFLEKKIPKFGNPSFSGETIQLNFGSIFLACPKCSNPNIHQV